MVGRDIRPYRADNQSKGQSRQTGSLANRGKGLRAEANGVLRGGGPDGQVPHLSSRAGLGLAVEVEDSALSGLTWRKIAEFFPGSRADPSRRHAARFGA